MTYDIETFICCSVFSKRYRKTEKKTEGFKKMVYKIGNMEIKQAVKEIKIKVRDENENIIWYIHITDMGCHVWNWKNAKETEVNLNDIKTGGVHIYPE